MSMSRDKFYGKCRYYSVSSTALIHPRLARWWAVSTTPAITLYLPTVERMRVGGITVGIINVGSNTFTVEDNDGATLATVAAGQAVLLSLVDNSSESGTWVAVMRTVGGGAGILQRLQTVAVCGGTGTLRTHSRFDIPTVSWVGGSAIPDDHAEGAFLRTGPRANLIGNYTLGASSTYNHEMDESGAWTTRAAAPAQFGRTCGVGIRGRGLIFGGDSLGRADAYTVDSWATLAAMPIVRSRGTAQRCGNRAYIMPGDPVNVPPIAYEASADYYFTVASMNQPARRSVGSFEINGRVYVVGGRSDSPVVRYDVNEEYNPITDSWAARAALLAGSRYGGAGIGGNNSGGYFGGKNSSDATTNDAALYISDTWTVIPSLPANRGEIDNQGSAL